MTYSVPRAIVDHILLGAIGERRQLQDSPILGDVWIAFAEQPTKAQELLIAPHKSQSANAVATILDDLIARYKATRKERKESNAQSKQEDIRADLAALQGFIAARLNFCEVLHIIVPRTSWWRRQQNSTEMQTYLKRDEGIARIRDVLVSVKQMMLNWSGATTMKQKEKKLSAFDRYAVLAGVILWAAEQEDDLPDQKLETFARAFAGGATRVGDILIELFLDIIEERAAAETIPGSGDLVYQVSRNRDTELAIAKSTLAVKADAARSLFNVETSNIAWAVLDSGIRGNHPAFHDAKRQSRIVKSFDFSKFRQIVSRDNRRIFGPEQIDKEAQEEILGQLRHDDLQAKPSKPKAIEYLKQLTADMVAHRPIDWSLVEPFIEIKTETIPKYSDHGTHVGGIIGARRPDEGPEDASDGMCPDIKLYDFRVLADTTQATEFAIIAAMQFIRYINDRNEFYTIHGANLSLSIPHDVRNYACGRTPVCVECERLIESGVVVVAAAGNHGYQRYTTNDGSYDGYTAFSITDPGNADGVITVGATHRYSPHTYGVSFFSSRGPTGGRSRISSRRANAFMRRWRTIGPISTAPAWLHHM